MARCSPPGAWLPKMMDAHSFFRCLWRREGWPTALVFVVCVVPAVLYLWTQGITEVLLPGLALAGLYGVYGVHDFRKRQRSRSLDAGKP